MKYRKQTSDTRALELPLDIEIFRKRWKLVDFKTTSNPGEGYILIFNQIQLLNQLKMEADSWQREWLFSTQMLRVNSWRKGLSKLCMISWLELLRLGNFAFPSTQTFYRAIGYAKLIQIAGHQWLHGPIQICSGTMIWRWTRRDNQGWDTLQNIWPPLLAHHLLPKKNLDSRDGLLELPQEEMTSKQENWTWNSALLLILT